MAERSKEPCHLSCSICLDILKSPVSLNCGHSYCMDCINGYWDQEDHGGVYSCPQCRHTYTPRPVLNKNTLLADLAGELCPSPEKDAAGPGDVECDFCSVKKLKAAKTCLVCLASYCVTHLQPHFESAAFKRHKLVDVSASIQDKICPKHDKLLEVFCRSDGQCICLLCVMDEHKGHDTVSAAAERKEKQKLFGKKKERFQQDIQERERQLRQLRKKVKELQIYGKTADDQNEKAYSEIVQMAGRRRAAVKELIGEQEKAAVTRAKVIEGRLEREISELKKTGDQLKQLSITEDHIDFLQSCKAIFDNPEPNESSDFNIGLQKPFDFVTKAISNMKVTMEKLEKANADISETFPVDPDPRTRHEFSLYSCHLSLDPNTAFENILLSEGNRKVTWIKKAQAYPYHPERFTKYDQVFCNEGLSGVGYWEVQWRGPRVEVAMSYKGEQVVESAFGCTDQSWCISLSHVGCTFWHNNIKTKVLTPCSSTVGVYLNHSAGSLSFYSVADSGHMDLLHRVKTTFSQILYPGFMVSRGSSVRIVPSE